MPAEGGGCDHEPPDLVTTMDDTTRDDDDGGVHDCLLYSSLVDAGRPRSSDTGREPRGRAEPPSAGRICSVPAIHAGV